MLKLGCTLQNLASICLQKTTTAMFCRFTESDKDLLEKINEDIVGEPSVVLTRKTVEDKTFIRYWTNFCQSNIGIDARQLYFFSMCQTIATGL